jgi:hypothetical protein
MAAKMPIIDPGGPTMGVCLLVWCLGQRLMLSDRLTFTHELLVNRPTSETILAYELPWVVVGAVVQTGRDAVFAGVLPLTAALFHGHLLLAGGAMVASTDVPHEGTRANFLATAMVPVTDRLAIAYWHWSNGNLANNPSVNALGVSICLRSR